MAGWRLPMRWQLAKFRRDGCRVQDAGLPREPVGQSVPALVPARRVHPSRFFFELLREPDDRSNRQALPGFLSRRRSSMRVGHRPNRMLQPQKAAKRGPRCSRISQYMQEIANPTPLGAVRKPPGPVVIWNLIRRCNLTCKHCYSISADKDFAGELSTDEV